VTVLLLTLASVLASLVVALPFLFVRAVRRRRDRMAAWLCPHCGKPFGQEAAAQWRGWRGDIQWTDQICGQPYAGPLLQCYKCVQNVRFTWDGKAVEAEKNATAESNAGVTDRCWDGGWNEKAQCLRVLGLILAILGLAVLVALLVLIWKLAA